MNKQFNPKLKYIASAIAIAVVSACSSESSDTGMPPDDGGGGLIIGTGGIIQGTTTSNKLYASNTIEVRASSDFRSTATFGAQGRFTFESEVGEGPWLLRSDLGNGNYLYGIAADSEAETQIQNIHSYSDAVVRSWYASRNLDIDAEFEASGALVNMPSLIEIVDIHDSLLAVVADVVENYNITGLNLNTTEFAANGTGVDQFILQNPVIRNEETITITIFDPDNNTASVAVEDYSLADDITTADTTAPSSPTELRALPSASDEITLVWDVASDNVGIARYSISRDGTEIATSPYPVYVDGGLNGTTTYDYSVIALDAAGNESTASLTVSASPLGSTDSTAPPTPSSVRIDTRRGSLDLEWTQTDIGDVASYAISRGNEPTNLPPYVNVNSTFFFDDAVNAGEQYCYQIMAVDASGNESTPTGVTCATAPGTAIAGGGGGSGPQPPVDSTDDLTAPQVDVSNVACTNEIVDSIIETAVTLPAGCYVALDGITILEQGNLTLDPGVIIKFGSRESLRVDAGASLTARGTEENPIVLTGLETSPGHWNGISFRFSNSANNVLDHVQVEYAGNESNDDGGISFSTNRDNPARLAMSNSTLRFNAGPGISIPEHIELSSFDGNRITGNELPVIAYGTRVNLLDKRSTYTGNTLDAIYVLRTIIDTDTTWPQLQVPYHSNSLFVDAEFTIEPDVNILFEDTSEFRIGQEGTLIAVGTEAAPISLSGLSGSVGAWQGLRFAFSNNDNRLSYVTLQHGGANSIQDAAISTQGNSGGSSRLSLNNVTISDNVGFGIGADFFTVFPEFENVTITRNDGLAIMDIYAAQAFNNAGNFTGNTENAIVLRQAFIDDGDVTLSNADVPYHADDIFIDNILTLEEGVTLSMVASAQFRVNPDGALTANGTASAPVSIVGRQRLPGFWNGIEYRTSNSPLNRLSHTLLADGGDGVGGLEKAANARFVCRSSNPSRLTIENSRIENSAGFGLFLEEEGCLVNIDANSTFTNNALGNTN